MDDRIEATKAELKKRVIAGEADGINGVGIDGELEKLVVFFTDHEKATATLRSLDHGFIEYSVLEDGSPPPEDDEEGEDLGERARLLPLAPSSVIKSADGGKGRIGCFVKSGGELAALTSAHIFQFQLPDKDVFVRRSRPHDFVQIGKTFRFPTLLPPPNHRNRADASLFLPDLTKVTLKKDSRIGGDFFDAAGLPGLERKPVLNLTSRVQGTVLDVKALIAYDVSIAGTLYRNVVFDQQVLVKNQTANRIFGQKSQSGSLVVKAGQPDEGKAVGIYVYATKNRQYHYVTPFFACADELGIDSIYNP